LRDLGHGSLTEMGLGKSRAAYRLATQHVLLVARLLAAATAKRSQLKIFGKAKTAFFVFWILVFVIFAPVEFQHSALERERSFCRKGMELLRPRYRQQEHSAVSGRCPAFA
jgi:hypothetical protein